jgi:hypothetical protein
MIFHASPMKITIAISIVTIKRREVGGCAKGSMF